MADPTRYKSNLLRRLLEDIEGLEGIFADLDTYGHDEVQHPERPRPDDRRLGR